MKNYNGLKDLIFEDHVLEHLRKFHKKLQPFGNLPINFHWSDSAKLIKMFQYKIKNDESFYQSLKLIKDNLDHLKSENIWLKKDDQIITLSVYDVYFTLVKHLKSNEYEDQLFNSQEVSFVAPTGPFMNITMVELITQDAFKEFLYFNILKNKMPQRSFRLHTKGEIVMQFGSSMNSYSIVNLCQITDNGVLFSCSDELVLEELNHCELVKFYIDEGYIKDLMIGKSFDHNDLVNLFSTNDKSKYFLTGSDKVIKSLSYDSGISGKFFLFIRYVHMKESDLPHVFKQFIDQMKLSVNEAAS